MLKLFNKLYVKLIVAICVPLMLLQAGMMTLEYGLRRQEDISDLQSYLKQSAQLQAALLDANLSAITQVASSAASYLKYVAPDDNTTLNSLIRNTLTQNPLIDGVAIVYQPHVRSTGLYSERTKDDLHVLTVDRSAFDYTVRPWFAEVVTLDKSVWSGPYQGHFPRHERVITVSVPFTTKDNARGVVGIDVQLNRINHAQDWIGLWDGFVRIMDQQGNYLTPLPPSIRSAHDGETKDNIFAIGERLQLPSLVKAGRKMVSGESGVVQIPDPLDGDGTFWLAYAPIANTGWSLSVLIDENAVMADIYGHLKSHLIIAVAILLLVLTTIILITRHMTQPLARLNKIARAVGKGNLELRMGNTGTEDEIGSFAHVFDRMLDNLQVAISERMHEAEARQALQKEMELAREIQQNLLPPSICDLSVNADFTLQALCKPARQISGDFYDYFMLDSKTLVLVIADVCGKGMPAALYMALTRTTLRNFSFVGQSPLQAVQSANAALAQNNADAMFVTLFYAHYDISTGLLRYVCAGHPAPLIQKNDGSVREIKGQSPLLGVFLEEEFSEESITLLPGEQVIFFTDGVTEAGLQIEDHYGEERLAALINNLRGKSVAETVQTVADTIQLHTNGEQEDDITLMVLRRQKAE